MKITIVLLFTLSQVGYTQPQKPFKTDYFVTVKEKPQHKNQKGQDWPVYSDPEMNKIAGRLAPGRIVHITGASNEGVLLYIIDDKLSGYVTYKALSLNGIYWIGMTEAVARFSLGDPDKINGSSNGLDQWIYDKKELYLYFSEGVLDSFQDVRK